MLPKLQVPTHSILLPISNHRVQYRPFTVKEEKILLMANESKTEADMLNAFKQVIGNCITDKIDVGKLPMFDLEVLFMLIRAVSVGEISEFVLTDEHGKNVPMSINLNTVVKESIAAVKAPPSSIQLSEHIGVVMKPISLDLFADQLVGSEIDTQQAFDLLANLIESVYDDDNVYKLADFSRTEIDEFLESFTSEAVNKIYEYINNYPRVEYTLPYKNSEGESKELTLKGMVDFFQYV